MRESNAAGLWAKANAHRKVPLSRRLRVPAGATVTQWPLEPGGSRTAITAAAQVLNPSNRGKTIDRAVKRAPVEEWQSEAWALRDETGELRFIGDRQARACSQVRIFIAKRESATSEPVKITDTTGPVYDLHVALFGNTARVEQELKRAAQHIIYSGESMLVASEDDNKTLSWSAYSGSELTGSKNRWKLSDGLDRPRDLTDADVVIRAWNPHPEHRAFADAPVRAVLPVARELRGLTQYVSAQIDSRLAGSGLLLLPQGIESAFSHDELDEDGEPLDDDDRTSIGDELTDYMMVPIQDRAAAGSVVPFMAIVPPELIDKAQYLTFSSPLDKEAPSLRDEAIRRIGLGMDSDPSVLLGQASSNHWSAWAVDDNEVKFGVVPVVSTICHALTVGLVRPLLESDGVADAHLYQVWYDETPLQVRPDRSKDAQLLYEKDAISLTVLRTENGFSDTDAPSPDELRDKRLWEMLQGPLVGYAPQVLSALGIDIPGVTDQATATAPQPAAADVGATPTVDVPDVADEPSNSPPVFGNTEGTQPL